MRALIVSREERTREWVRDSLGPDWEVLDAANSNEALRTVAERPADLVILDELTGPYGAFGAALELKQTQRPPAVIILLHRAQDVWLARWSQADRWLLHPVAPFELATLAAELVTAARPGAEPGQPPEPPEPEERIAPVEDTSAELTG